MAVPDSSGADFPTVATGLLAGPETSAVVNWRPSATIVTSPFGAGADEARLPVPPPDAAADAPGDDPAAAVLEVFGGKTPAWTTMAPATSMAKKARVLAG